jgi:hypothetical protein
VACDLRNSADVATTWCRIARAEPVVGEEVSPLDELFFSLDGTTVATDREEWRVEVAGIHFGAAGRWVQLNLCGDTTYSVTMKIDTVDPQTIRKDIVACLAAPSRPAPSLPF